MFYWIILDYIGSYSIILDYLPQQPADAVAEPGRGLPAETFGWHHLFK